MKNIDGMQEINAISDQLFTIIRAVRSWLWLLDSYNRIFSKNRFLIYGSYSWSKYSSK
jgi:hypothetical protein